MASLPGLRDDAGFEDIRVVASDCVSIADILPDSLPAVDIVDRTPTSAGPAAEPTPVLAVPGAVAGRRMVFCGSCRETTGRASRDSPCLSCGSSPSVSGIVRGRHATHPLRPHAFAVVRELLHELTSGAVDAAMSLEDDGPLAAATVRRRVVDEAWADLVRRHAAVRDSLAATAVRCRMVDEACMAESIRRRAAVSDGLAITVTVAPRPPPPPPQPHLCLRHMTIDWH